MPNDESKNDGGNLITPRSDDSTEVNVFDNTKSMPPIAGSKTAEIGNAFSDKNVAVAAATSSPTGATTSTAKTVTAAMNSSITLEAQKGIANSSTTCSNSTMVRQNGLLPRLEYVETIVSGKAAEGTIPDRLKALEDVTGLPPLEVKTGGAAGGGRLLFLFHRRIERLERELIG